MRKYWQAILMGLIVGCAVEAGNADKEDDGKPTGKVQVLLSSSESESGNALYLNLTAVEVRGYNSSNEDLYTSLPTASDTINLYDNPEDETAGFALTTEQSVGVGIYEEITVVLNRENPVTYIDGFNYESVGKFEDDSVNAFVINERFQVQSGATTTIVINLDTQLKPEEGDPGRYRIRPRAKLIPKGRGIVHRGEIIDERDPVAVCAYAYSPMLLPPPPPRPQGDFQGPPPPPRFDATIAKIFLGPEDVIKDETRYCDHAFARARVVDGTYKFFNLLPATYDFRVFFQDGSFEDHETGITLLPPVRLLDSDAHIDWLHRDSGRNRLPRQ